MLRQIWHNGLRTWRSSSCLWTSAFKLQFLGIWWRDVSLTNKINDNYVNNKYIYNTCIIKYCKIIFPLLFAYLLPFFKNSLILWHVIGKNFIAVSPHHASWRIIKPTVVSHKQHVGMEILIIRVTNTLFIYIYRKYCWHMNKSTLNEHYYKIPCKNYYFLW